MLSAHSVITGVINRNVKCEIMRAFLLTLLLTTLAHHGHAESRLLIAVASNFEPTARALADDFQQANPAIHVVISSAASGTHFHQISRGAPFAIFLSADQDYPRKLAAAGKFGAVKTYALGELVLASHQAFDYNEAMQAVKTGSKIAIANPQTAPYGRAATEVLAYAGITSPAIQAQNVAQTLHFLTTGAVQYALTAKSHVLHQAPLFWLPAPKVYGSIEQAGILLEPNNDQAVAFWHYLFSAPARNIITQFGYGVSSDA